MINFSADIHRLHLFPPFPRPLPASVLSAALLRHERKFVSMTQCLCSKDLELNASQWDYRTPRALTSAAAAHSSKAFHEYSTRLFCILTQASLLTPRRRLPFSFLSREMNFLGGMTPTFFFWVAMLLKRSARQVRRDSFLRGCTWDQRHESQRLP